MTSPTAQHAPTTLAQAQSGCTYRVVGINGGRGVRVRLAGMGILPGQTIRVLRANSVGPVTIAVRTGKLALGRGISRRLVLCPEAADSQP